LKIGAYAASSVMMEKQIEALELALLALGHSDSAKSLYTVSDKVTNDKGVTTLKISSTKDELNYSNKLGLFKGKMSKGYDVAIGQMENGDFAIDMNAKSIKTSADAIEIKKTFVNLFEDSFRLVVVALPDDPTKLGIKLESSGTFNAGSDKGFKKDPFTYTLKMQIDRASLTESEVKIVNSDMTLTLGKDNFVVSAKDLTVKVEGRCNELVGSGVIESDKYKNPIAFDKSSITVGGNRWKQDLAQCGQRPTVDIGRLLVY
jgi:hypothetical protein